MFYNINMMLLINYIIDIDGFLLCIVIIHWFRIW